MPMHDWTKVLPGIFHDFHQRWIVAISNALNDGRLPENYYAMAEQVVEGPIPDVLTLEYVDASDSDANEQSDPTTEQIAVVAKPPAVMYTLEADQQLYIEKANRLAVFHASGDRPVAYLEIVSPGNKQSEHNITRFLDKCAEAMRNGLNLLIIDPFPSTIRDPKGLHARFWIDYFGQTDSPGVTTELPLSLAAYRAELVPTAYFNPVGTKEHMPEMPLYLTPDYFIGVPLEETYQTAYRGVPNRWKKVIESNE